MDIEKQRNLEDNQLKIKIKRKDVVTIVLG